MTDYLLVHGAGQGSWSWGRVWGYLTAPEEHPPRLYAARRANQVYALDLPGHGAFADGKTANVTLEACVNAITEAVQKHGLHDLVLVGHGFAAPMVLQAAARLPQPPKRVVLIAGLIPGDGQSMLAALPGQGKMAFQALTTLSKISRQELRLPRPAIARYLCNGIDPMEVVHIVGNFGPLPTRVMKTETSLEDSRGRSPVTYVVLTQDKILPPTLQRAMAARLPGVQTLDLDSPHQIMLHQPKRLAEILLRYA